MVIVIRKPNECSNEELDKFEELVLSGGQVSAIGLKVRIHKCKYLGLCFIENELVGVSAIKIPTISKTMKILAAAGINNHKPPDFELGYSITLRDFRGKGINKAINDRLLNELEIGEKIYSTTNNDIMRKYFTLRGFKKIGKSFPGRYNETLDYFEI